MTELIMICQSCGKRIEEGHLGIDTAALNTYRDQVEQWRANNPDAGPMSKLLDMPETVSWQAHCEACEPNTCGYCIQVSELRTYKDLLKWTAHLMGKTWLADTDWEEMLEGIVSGQDRRVREVPR